MLRIDLSAPASAYEQIADGLRALLVQGDLKPGMQLPTVRSLASDLGLHHNTVAEAYRHLAAEGWLELRRRHGARVLDRRYPAMSARARAFFASQLRHTVARAISGGLSRGAAAAELTAALGELGQSAELAGIRRRNP